MQTLNVQQVEQVNGGLANVAFGAAVGGTLAAYNSYTTHGSVKKAAGAAVMGAAGGAFLSAGGGLLTTGVKVGSRVVKSATAGSSSTGLGSAFSLTSSRM